MKQDKPIPIKQIPNKLFARLPIEKVYKNGRVRLITPPLRSDSKVITRKTDNSFKRKEF